MDRYIDQDETGIYGPYTVTKMRKRLIGKIPAFDGAVNYLADELEAATATVTAAIAAGRGARTSISTAAEAKRDPLTDAIDVLARFSSHLDGHKEGTVVRTQWFPQDGTASGVGRSARKVSLALVHLATELAKPDGGVRDAAAWAKEATDAAAALAPAVEGGDAARDSRSETTPATAAARSAWLVTYKACKALAESMLLQTGQPDQMNRIFYDLAVPAGVTKVTEPPVEPDEEPLPPVA